MKNAKITWVRQYRKKETQKMVFVYEVSGTPEQLAKYKESKGTFYTEDRDTKKPLFFSTRYVGNSCPLSVTEKGEFVADTTKLDQLHSLADTYGTELAISLQGQMINHNPTPEEEVEPVADDAGAAATQQKK